MTKPATVSVFIDTNTALHFKRPDQIDWLKLTGASEVVLIAAPILLRELEEQKVNNKSKKLRGRADKYIKWLRQFLLKPTNEVRPKVTWFFLPSEPQINFTDELLNESIGDDQLIASVLDYSRNSGERPLVMTADIGLEAKLYHRNIDVLTLPDDLQLPDEPDPIERENEDLRNKIARYESRMPKLSVAFEGGVQHQEIHVRDPKSYKVKSLAQIKGEYPFKSRSGERDLSPSVSNFHDIEQGIIDEHISTYNQQLREYFSDYQKYLDLFTDWHEEICMYHTVKLVISNDGTAPASNVDIELYFPDGVVPVGDDNIPEEPKPPDAPEKNQGIFASLLPDIRPLNVLESAQIQQNWLTAHLSGMPDITLHENSICISYLKLKHGFSEISDPLTFRLVSRDAVGAFKINTRLSADEMPDAVEDDLHIRIDQGR